MSRLIIRESLGWCASAWIPPARMAPAASPVKVDPVTVMELAPRPTPVAWALASLPMPIAVWPRLTNWSPLKVMRVDAETCTAAGIWLQLGRAASNWVQPDVQEPNEGHDRFPLR